MRLAVCTVSPPGYLHSEAFREVSDTLLAAAQELGHDAVAATRADFTDRLVIVLGPNLLTRHPLPLAPGAILYNLEQAGPGPWFDQAVLELFQRHPVWDYSDHNADTLAAMGVPRPRVVPIGWSPSLRRIPPAGEDIDVLFYGSFNARRAQVLDELRAAGARVHAVFGVYGAERDALIARSRLVLNLHYFEARVFEMVRVSYLLGNGRAVVSERGASAQEEAPFEECIAFAAHADLARTCLELLENPAERARLGEAGRRVMESRPAARFLAAALSDAAARSG